MKSAKNPNRRELLGGLGAMGVIGISSLASAREAVDASTASAITTKADRLEYARLRDLDLDAPEVLARRQKMPTGKIGDITFGRLMSGSNLISMNMHARDLEYVSSLAERYNTEDRILMTPKENRRFIEMYESNSPNHAEYHDNMFCHDHEETVEFMQDVRIAVKAIEKAGNRKRPWFG